MDQKETADDFLSFAHKFKLGCLLTEQQNPKTIGMSDMAKNDLPKAIQMIKGLDFEIMNILKEKIPQLQGLYRQVNDTFEKGGRIFICGCGATGRLALVLETIWRQQTREIYPDWQNRTCAFMAGGDAALIKSVEDFEDHPQFAEQQLVELGFKEGDMLIGSTEGGETPWVIGAIWKSISLTSRKPYILYGNTDEILIKNVVRSKQFIQSEKINKINCNVGYMALAGSTRMQSTTILMHAIGLTMLGCDRIRSIRHPTKTWIEYANQNIDTFISYLKQTDFGPLQSWIESESALYKKGQHITYHTIPYYAISILTDTTERSPTFSLAPFSNKYFPIKEKCWCNMKVLHQKEDQTLSWDETVQRDWKTMLADREVRGLDTQYWAKYQNKVSKKVILGQGMHQSYENKLTINEINPIVAKIQLLNAQSQRIIFNKYPTSCRLSHHSLLKILLNTASTLIMGRMNRYQSNIMTYVKPTNYKLIDRASRYIQILKPEFSYEQAVRMVYKLKQDLGPEQPIVLKAIEALQKQKKQ